MKSFIIRILTILRLANKDLFPEITSSGSIGFTKEQRREIYAKALEQIKNSRFRLYGCIVISDIADCHQNQIPDLFPEFFAQKPVFSREKDAWWEKFCVVEKHQAPRIRALERAIQLTY